ncbi:hypothetical protein E0H26_14335 [Micromonospora zingiberis]|uniref:Uncharacterized protein n=1 Tax=Micromonospora zingiberis TaxID=2053011 RepID=A0A4R0GKA0_9ACTN|nr:hypothetical protein [Micromonospora zingiberis]TCB96793.1 hypothetical protein E0H26_14335 [Micromonospora zingiberis]
MTRAVRNAATVVVGVVLGLLSLGMLAPSGATAAEDTYTVKIHGGGAVYNYTLCLKTTTTMARNAANNGDRECTGKRNSTDGSYDMSAAYKPGDSVKMDVEMHTGLVGESVTKDNIEITGATSCTISGLVHAGKFECDVPVNSVHFSPPAIEAYTINTNQHGSIRKLLDFMAWLVSAAAVTGLLITGATLASQLRRGALEERTEYTKHLSFVLAACLLATTAGPIVSWLDLTK